MAICNFIVNSQAPPRALDVEFAPRLGEYILLPGPEGFHLYRVDRIVHSAKEPDGDALPSSVFYVNLDDSLEL